MKLILKAVASLMFSGLCILPTLADDASSAVDAKDTKDLKKAVEDQSINYVETAQKGISLSGYVDVSYTNQFAGRGQTFGNSDENGNNQHTLRQFDTDANGFNVQAVKIALEKALPDKNDWAAGFRLDTIYGSDARSLNAASGGNVVGTTSTGSSFSASSDFYLEQALIKFRVPVANGLDIYAGKFVTFLGYEVIESPANLNFSRGLLFTNAIPLTHTGVYADYKFDNMVEAKFGIVDGWNNSVSLKSSDPAASYGFGGKALTGQVNVTNPGKNANICTSFIYSPDSTESAGVNNGGDNGPSAVFDIWGNWNPTFVKDSALTLGFNVDLGWSGAAGLPGEGGPNADHDDSNTWWGMALYSSYKFNKIFTLSGRGEYLHSDPTSYTLPKFGFGAIGQVDPASGNYISDSQDDFSYTLTGSFNICDNLLTRVEYRVDVLQGSSLFPEGYYNPISQNNPGAVENEISLEAVYSF